MNTVFRLGMIVIAGMTLAAGGDAFARDASFVDPSSSSRSGSGNEAIVVEPRTDTDVGETTISVSRRVTLFFANQSGASIDVENMSITTDSNVSGVIVSDDCSKEGKIASASRCAVVVSLTPSSSGTWSSEVLLTHKGPGRIARAKIIGKATVGANGVDHKETGLSLSTKDVAPVGFGDVEVGGKAVRSALLVNDSMDPITLLSIDLIAAENGLSRLEQGCAVDMELKPGESCPATLVWQPTTKGAVFTDLIVRHSGKTGFIVVPVRGTSRDANSTSSGASSRSAAKADEKVIMPPTAEELEKAAASKLPTISASELGDEAKTVHAAPAKVGVFHLIGTVGNRAILLKPDSTTVTAGVGESIKVSSGNAKLLSITPRAVVLSVDGKSIHLDIESASALTDKASSASESRKTGTATGSSSSGSSAGTAMSGTSGDWKPSTSGASK